MTTIDEKQLQRFNNYDTDWWNFKSRFNPLLSYNNLRIPFIINTLNSSEPQNFSKCRVLDVGCGVGFLSEGLALKGFQVTGIDVASNLINTALNHKDITLNKAFTKDPNSSESCGLKKLQYREEDIGTCEKTEEKFDIVVASEVIEHVNNAPEFVRSCTSCVKPGGSLVITTPNRTWFSYLVTIFIAEHLLQWIPKGTHEYRKFIKPKELKQLVSHEGLIHLSTRGTFYLPWPFQRWFWMPCSLNTYMMSFYKPPR